MKASRWPLCHHQWPMLLLLTMTVWCSPSVQAQEKIVGGDEAPDGVYDFFAHPDPAGCGATLVHPQVILTAAHCACAFRDVDMVIGTNNREDRSDALDVVAVTGAAIVHPDYNFRTQSADVMLIRLSRPANAPTANLATNVPNDGAFVKAIGFGLTSEPDGGLFGGGGDLSNTLREVDVPMVNIDTCDNNYDGAVDKTTMICAGQEGLDSCQGDSGGPLLDDSLNVVGITSWGEGCARANRPGVYTNVPHFTLFIQQAICQLAETEKPGYCTNGDIVLRTFPFSTGRCRGLLGNLLCFTSDFGCRIYDLLFQILDTIFRFLPFDTPTFFGLL